MTLLLLLLLAVAPASSGTAKLRQAKRTLARSVLSVHGVSRASALRRLLDGLVDYERVSANSLGAGWDGLEPPQRREFIARFRELLLWDVMRRLEDASGDFQVDFRSEEGTPHRAIRCYVRKPNSEDQIPVLVMMEPHGPSFRVVDVTIDEINMGKTYRSQFTHLLDRRGYDEMLARMVKKTGDLQRELSN